MLLSDSDLVLAVRRGDPSAWRQFIARYEGRLLAFAERRLKQRAEAEDIVQETFLGFLTSLPNYDPRTPIENFLFSIAAYKLTDALRRQGRRPRLPWLPSGDEDGDVPEPVGAARRASSMARSKEHRVAEENVMAESLRVLIQSWTDAGEWERLRCVELLFVRGLANKDVADHLLISEQAVANHKQYVMSKLKDAAAKARLRVLDDDLFGPLN